MKKPRDSARAKTRSVGHRYAGVSALRLDEVLALTVRYDEEARDVGETMLVRLRPGRCEAVRGFAGHARAVVETPDATWVLDGAGALHRGNTGAWSTVLQGVDVIASCGLSGGMLAASREGLVELDGRSVRVRASLGGARVHAMGASGERVVVVREGDVVLLDGDRAPVPLALPSTMDANAIGAVDLGADGTVVLGEGPRVWRTRVGGTFVEVGRCTGDVAAVAQWGDRVFAGVRGAGLYRGDDDGWRCIRPSLRAHTLVRTLDGLVVGSDLFIATSDDGVDFATRDLAASVRQLETHGGSHGLAHAASQNTAQTATHGAAPSLRG